MGGKKIFEATLYAGQEDFKPLSKEKFGSFLSHPVTGYIIVIFFSLKLPKMRNTKNFPHPVYTRMQRYLNYSI